MKKNDHELEARLTMESLDHIGKAELPSHLEKDFLARLDRVQREDGKRTKWFWAAAVVLFIINGTVAFNYSATKNETSSTASVSPQTTGDHTSDFNSYYYGNTGSLYQ